MSRIYATEDDGTKHLVVLECDLCGARIKPHLEIAESGWVKVGNYYGPGDERNDEMDVCPEHV